MVAVSRPSDDSIGDASSALVPGARAWLLLDIVDEFDADLRRANQRPFSEELDYAAASEFSTLRAGPRVASDVPSWDPPTSEVTAALHRWILSSLTSTRTSRAEAAARAQRRVEIWTLVGRNDDVVVDFEALLSEVIASESVQKDIANIGFRPDVLSREVREHRNEILALAPGELAAVIRARDKLLGFAAEELAAGVAAVATPAQPGPFDTLRRLVRRTSLAKRSLPTSGAKGPVTSTPAASSTRSGRRRELEANLVEAAAVAEQFVRSALERDVRSALSGHGADMRRIALRLATTEGLAQVVDDRLEIRTKAIDGLVSLLRRMKGGSVGIAGSRGAGKSTILRRFCDGREKFGERPILAVAISAPVVYDSRDFMLHLFAEVCRSAGAAPPPEEVTEVQKRQSSALTDSARRALVAWLPDVGVALMFGGVGSLVSALWKHGNGLVIAGTTVLGASAAIAMEISGRRRIEPPALYGQQYANRTLASGTALGGAVVGMGVVVAGVLGVDWSPRATKSLVVALVGVVLLVIGRQQFFAWLEAQREIYSRREERKEWPPRGNELVSLASIRLEEMRYQQTIKAGHSGKIGLPLGLELGLTTERSLARYPMTFPEVVDRFTKFLATAAKTHDVLVAVDELDKLDTTDDTANRFLNDLKAAFGVADTYFLVSVSEDAMSRFERRGLPFRDVFDSTFDEIVRVDPLSLAEAQTLLAARVVGMPYIYSALCHVLAAGIPRDLIRMARRLVDVNERLGRPDKLGVIVAALMAAEIEAKSAAVRQAATALSASDVDWARFLGLIEEFRGGAGTPEELHAAAARLHTEASARLTGQLPDQQYSRGRDELRRLAIELATYGYFVATVLEFFHDGLTEAEIDDAANGGASSPSLEALAYARMGFTVNATTAWAGIDLFRSTVGLRALPRTQAPPDAPANDGRGADRGPAAAPSSTSANQQ